MDARTASAALPAFATQSDHGDESIALIRRIEAEFDVVGQRLRFGSLELAVRSLRDPDTLLDEATLNAAHGDMAWHPYWGKLWDAAIGLASILSQRELHGMTVLDLGCGLGVTGAVAAARGAQVVLADHAPPALDFARLNSWPWRERVDVRLLDWRTDDLTKKFDLIVGADIVYDRQDIPFLDRFWRKHLADGGEILLADPGRLMTLDLMPLLEATGWKIERGSYIAPPLTKPINLYRLS